MSETPTAPPVFGNVHTDDVPYDGNVMSHDAMDEMLNDTQFTVDSSPLEDDAKLYDEFLRSDQPSLDEPNAAFIEPRKRTPTAKKYEKKTAGLFSLAVKVTASQPQTLADSAALLMYGPNISEKIGDLAASNARVARGIDMLTEQTENPAAAVIIAALPLVLQVVRNHEPVMESSKPVRRLKVPFTKRSIRLRIGFKMGKRMKNMTQDPVKLQHHVFTNPAVVEALAKQGIIVSVG